MATNALEPLALAASFGSGIGIASVAKSEEVVGHPLFAQLKSLEATRIFMQFHVWCVWDFMCLAKSIQAGLSPAASWVPSSHPVALAHINDILAAEETDVGPDGRVASHFEIFVKAMKKAGVDTRPITTFVRCLRSGWTPKDAMQKAGAARASIDFVMVTLKQAAGPLHVRAASFCLGREELVPRMLIALSGYVPWRRPELAGLRWYVDRHIEVDIKQHGPSSHAILAAVVGDSKKRAMEATRAANAALNARQRYLDAILKEVYRSRR